MKFLFFFFFAAVCHAQTPVINEVMSLNVSVLSDDDNDYPDWIEIYNPGGSAVNLSGYGLSDDITKPLKWTFPNVELPAKSFVFVYASDKNRFAINALHANFKITSKGERILLSDGSGFVLDSLSVPPLAVDVSFGRSPDGHTIWAYFISPTPGSANNTAPLGGSAAAPQFSQEGGFYNAAFTVELSKSNTQSEIRYTTTGADPNVHSRSYLSPITINKTTVLKARCFEKDKLPSPVITKTYFLNEKHNLPVISLSTHPDNFFDDDIGIYVEGNGTSLGGYPNNPIGPPANYWEDWERPVHIELYEPDGSLGFRVNAGIKMSGKTTRQLPQKSFAVFMRSQYGADALDYPLFPNYSVTSFTSFLLRNAGSDNTINEGGVHFRDGLTALLLNQVDLDYQMYRPCQVYINGDCWGIYNIREKLNEDYLAAHHGVDPNNVDILDDYHVLYPLVVQGDADDFNTIINYMQTHSLQNDAHADYIESKINVQNYLTYMAVQIFFANHDGPGHNCKFWRPREADGRYRWLLYDTDHSLGMRLFIPNFHYAPDAYMDNTIAYYREENGPSWPNPPESTFLFRKILENENFTFRFINILNDLMNSAFREEVTLPIYAQVKNQLEPAMEQHLSRWGGSLAEWQENVHVIEDFLTNRIFYLQDHVIDEFQLGGLAEVKIQIEPPGAGQIKINSLYHSTNWSGLYFQDVPIEFTAIPNIGFRFAGWQGMSTSQSSIVKTLADDISITATFENTPEMDVAVINEINYNSPTDFDSEDWIELYNPLSTPVDLSRWVLADKNLGADYIFPDNTTIPSYEYLVIARNMDNFKKLWPHVKVMGNLPFGLDSSGDFIKLLNAKQHIVDSLTYESSSPWPWQPDGQGATLALRDPNFDNTKAENWMASFGHGTPGSVNNIFGKVDVQRQPQGFWFKKAYPNPFNSFITIQFYLPQADFVRLTIFDILGRRVQTLVATKLSPGEHSTKWNGMDETQTRLPSGIYVVHIQMTGEKQSHKIALVY